MPKAKAAEAEQPTTGDTGDKPVKQQVREAAEAGKTRREIADEFGLSYQRVYQLTKDMDQFANSEGGSRARVIVEESDKLTEAGRGDLVGKPRVEAIRELFDEGMKVGDIARLLDTQYQVVFQATKSQRLAASGETDESEDSEADTDADEAEDDLEDEDDEDEDE